MSTAELRERLRKWAEVLDIPSGRFVNDDLLAAADAWDQAATALEAAEAEIERLRAELDEIRQIAHKAQDDASRLRFPDTTGQ